MIEIPSLLYVFVFTSNCDLIGFWKDKSNFIYFHIPQDQDQAKWTTWFSQSQKQNTYWGCKKFCLKKIFFYMGYQKKYFHISVSSSTVASRRVFKDKAYPERYVWTASKCSLCGGNEENETYPFDWGQQKGLYPHVILV